MTRRTLPGTAEQIDLWINHGLHIPTSTLTIFGGIDDEMCHSVIQKLHLIPENKVVEVFLDTSGGEEMAGLAIYDALARRKTRITVVGQALSMGAIILQAGKWRSVLPHSSVMIHTGGRSYEGRAEDVRREIQHDKRLDDICDTILLGKMRDKDAKLSLGVLRDIMSTDTYYLGKEIVEVGLADEVLEYA